MELCFVFPLCLFRFEMRGTDGRSEDSNAKYEIYVPDGRGDMAQQLLTLPEIRTLLARQADNPGYSETVSLEGGKVNFSFFLLLLFNFYLFKIMTF